MKLMFKFLSLVVIFASCQSYGMESKSQEFLVPRSGRSVERQLIAETKNNLVRDVIEVDTATAALNNMDTEGQMGESKEAIKVKDHSTEPLFKLLYDMVTTMPPELINLILDYAKEFRGYGELVGTIKINNLANNLVALSSQVLASYAIDGNTIELLDTEIGTKLKPINTLDKLRHVIALSENELAYSGQDYKAYDTITVTDWKKGTKNSIDAVETDQKNTKLVKLPNRQLASASDRVIRFWNSNTGEFIKDTMPWPKLASVVLLTENFVATRAAHTNTIALWNIDTNECIGSFKIELPEYADKAILIPLSATTIALATSDYKIIIGDIGVKELLKTINTNGAIQGIEKIIGKNILAVAEKEEQRPIEIRLYDIETGKLINRFDSGFATVHQLCSLANGYLAALGKREENTQEEIRIWN